MYKFILILILIGGSFFGGIFYEKETHNEEMKHPISMVKQSFKLGCEIGILYRQEGLSVKVNKDICVKYLEGNARVLNRLINKSTK